MTNDGRDQDEANTIERSSSIDTVEPALIKKRYLVIKSPILWLTIVALVGATGPVVFYTLAQGFSSGCSGWGCLGAAMFGMILSWIICVIGYSIVFRTLGLRGATLTSVLSFVTWPFFLGLTSLVDTYYSPMPAYILMGCVAALIFAGYSLIFSFKGRNLVIAILVGSVVLTCALVLTSGVIRVN
jgi:hypothetical protein